MRRIPGERCVDPLIPRANLEGGAGLILSPPSNKQMNTSARHSRLVHAVSQVVSQASYEICRRVNILYEPPWSDGLLVQVWWVRVDGWSFK